MKLLVLFLFCITLTSVNASFIDKVKDAFSNAKEDTREKIREVIAKKLDENCFKIPFTGYYICPPINPDKI